MSTGERVLPDYSVESLDEAWVRFGTDAPRHLMQDPGHCIRCGLCEATCPWECLYALVDKEQEVAFFLFEDANCARCGVCVEVCPTDCLYFARLSEETGATRTIGVVPEGKGVGAA